ncbi:MAG: hypothetical protein HYZ43_15005 [Flavobacteriia bacterium]|nr:hypothetical protein [Flavobacteriia bacterium]
MLRIIESKSAGGAKKYFDEGLSREGDYYLDAEQEIPGMWGFNEVIVSKYLINGLFGSIRQHNHPTSDW